MESIISWYDYKFRMSCRETEIPALSADERKKLYFSGCRKEFRRNSAEQRAKKILRNLSELYAQAEDGRNEGAFLAAYDFFVEKRKEFRWSKEFILSEFSVDYKKITKLYYKIRRK